MLLNNLLSILYPKVLGMSICNTKGLGFCANCFLLGVIFVYSSKDIANRIKDRSKEQNVVIKQMLLECGLSKNALSSMLSGGSLPKSDNIAKIADYLNCSVDFLLGRTDNPNIGNTEAYIGGDNHGVQAVRNGTVIIGDSAEQEIITLLSKLSPAERHRAIADIIDLLNENYNTTDK